jgi:hypothetical protein
MTLVGMRGRSLGASAQSADRQCNPSGDEAETADGRDGAQPTDPGDGQEIEAARKDRDPGHKQPAGRPGPRVRPARGRPGHSQKPESVGQVIPNPCLVHRQHVDRESIAEAVCAKRPQQDSEPTQRRPRREPSCHHDSVSYRGRAPRGRNSRLAVAHSRERIVAPRSSDAGRPDRRAGRQRRLDTARASAVGVV